MTVIFTLKNYCIKNIGFWTECLNLCTSHSIAIQFLQNLKGDFLKPNLKFKHCKWFQIYLKSTDLIMGGACAVAFVIHNLEMHQTDVNASLIHSFIHAIASWVKL